MTPAAILSLVKDLLIIVAVGLAAYFLVSYGKDIVKVSDIKAVQKQIVDNAATTERWQKEQSDADVKRAAALAKVGAAIAGQRAPVFVRGPPRPDPVPAAATKAGDQPGGAGGADQGRGIDHRPAVNQFELKYETALIECYAALDKWPRR